MLVLFFMFLIGCDRIDEVKKISTVKCKSCGKILEADTTIMKGHYNRDKGTLTTSEGRIHHLGYFGPVRKVTNDVTLTLCEECKKDKKKKSLEYFKKGKREYSRGNYTKAKNYFEDAIMTSIDRYPEADKWLAKADAKIYSEKKPVYREPKKYRSKTITSEMRRRIAYGKKLQRQVKRGMTIDVYGNEYEIISLSWIGMEDAFYYWFRTTDDYQDIKDLGFKHIQFLNGISYFSSVVVY